MAELDPYTWILDGVDVRDAGLHVLDTDGIEDGADLEEDTSDRQGDGEHAGEQRLTSRTITLTLGHNEDTDEDAMSALRRVMNPRTNRASKRTAQLRHTAGDRPTLTFLYRPTPGRFLRVPGDSDFLSVSRFSKAIQARVKTGPYLFGEPVDTAFTAGDTETIVNVGDVAATSVDSSTLGAMSWTITSAGGCVRPWLRHEDHDELWLYPGSVPAGGTLTVGTDRIVRVNGAIKYRSEGFDGAPVATWPILRPGDNDLTMDADTGGFTATLTTRSTW